MSRYFSYVCVLLGAVLCLSLTASIVSSQSNDWLTPLYADEIDASSYIEMTHHISGAGEMDNKQQQQLHQSSQTQSQSQLEQQFLAEMEAEMEADAEAEADMEADGEGEGEGEGEEQSKVSTKAAGQQKNQADAETEAAMEAEAEDELVAEDEVVAKEEKNKKKEEEKKKKKKEEEEKKKKAQALTPLEKMRLDKKKKAQKRRESAKADDSNSKPSLKSTPNHVHLHLTGSPYTRIVSYVTPVPEKGKKIPSSHAQFGLTKDKLSLAADGTSKHFKQTNRIKYQSIVHVVTLARLQPNTTYYYRVGSEESGWSKTYSFTTFPVNNASLTWSIFGDFGLKNAMSLNRLKYEVEHGLTQGIVHIGDIGYDLDGKAGRVGDEFLQAIEPLTARVPYLVGAGNHEKWDNYTQYKGRFAAVKEGVGKRSGSGTSLYYSVNVPHAHFIVLNTEVFWPRLDAVQAKRMLQWLRRDLQEANKPKNRAKYPWIVVFGHKPTYHRQRGRAFFTLTDLLHKYGVDLYVGGHQHNYARLYPQRGKKVQASQGRFLYTHPKYITELTIGSPGNKQKIEKAAPPKRLTANRIDKYGYGSLTIHNATHVTFEWQNVEAGEKKNDASIKNVEDHLTIVQDYHGKRNTLLRLPQPNYDALRKRIAARKAALKKKAAQKKKQASQKLKLSSAMAEQVEKKQQQRKTNQHKAQSGNSRSNLKAKLQK